MEGFIRVVCILALTRLAMSRLVIDIEDLDTLDAHMIEEKATFIEKVVRETNCEGVKDHATVYEYFVQENEEETRETAELVTKIANIQEEVYVNTNETWIQTTIKLRPDLNCLEHDDASLISTLQSDYLLPPSQEEYNKTMIPSSTPQYSGEHGEDRFLDKFIFKGKLKQGFFVEAGADDFVEFSNTLWFEMQHQWTGVLVEPNPTRFPKGFVSKRKAWGAPFCLGIHPRPHYSPFAIQTLENTMSGLVPEHVKDSYDLQCFPLYSLLLAVGNPTINYFSLDIEGAEFKVLKTVPWDKVDIEVMLVELDLAGKVFPGTREDVHRFLDEKGYDYAGTVGSDDIFIRKDLGHEKYKFDREMAAEFETYSYTSYDSLVNKDEL